MIAVQLSANSSGVVISPRKPHGPETARPYLPPRRRLPWRGRAPASRRRPGRLRPQPPARQSL